MPVHFSNPLLITFCVLCAFGWSRQWYCWTGIQTLVAYSQPLSNNEQETSNKTRHHCNKISKHKRTNKIGYPILICISKNLFTLSKNKIKTTNKKRWKGAKTEQQKIKNKKRRKHVVPYQHSSSLIVYVCVNIYKCLEASLIESAWYQIWWKHVVCCYPTQSCEDAPRHAKCEQRCQPHPVDALLSLRTATGSVRLSI